MRAGARPGAVTRRSARWPGLQWGRSKWPSASALVAGGGLRPYLLSAEDDAGVRDGVAVVVEDAAGDADALGDGEDGGRSRSFSGEAVRRGRGRTDSSTR